MDAAAQGAAVVTEFEQQWEGAPLPDEPVEDDAVWQPEPARDGHGSRAQPNGAAPTLRTQLLSVADLGQLPAVKPLVDGLLYANTLAQLSGPPGSFKSFVSVGISCALAAGCSSWEGHRIPVRQKVIYVAAEGASGLRARVYAWCEHHGIDPQRLEGWLYILPVPLQLGNVVHVGQAVEMARDVGAGLLVLDTRARCTLGLEENSATEQGEAVDAADRIRGAADCTVWGIHHSVRNGSSPRGSTAWDGAVWTDLRLTAEGLKVSVNVEKHKDAPSDKTFEYRMVPHLVSEKSMPDVDEAGRKSLVIFSLDGEKNTEILTGAREKVAKLAENSCGIEGLTRKQLVDLSVSAGVSEASAYRSVNDLVKASWLQNVGTENRPRYAYIGPTLDGGNDAQA